MLVELPGFRKVSGGNGIANDPIDSGKILAEGLEDASSTGAQRDSRIPRTTYAEIFGPTTGDLVRLGDTELWIKVEKDFAFYGDESKFGDGKVVRDGMGQATGRLREDCLDTVIINALIVDYTGIYKVCLSSLESVIDQPGRYWD